MPVPGSREMTWPARMGISSSAVPMRTICGVGTRTSVPFPRARRRSPHPRNGSGPAPRPRSPTTPSSNQSVPSLRLGQPLPPVPSTSATLTMLEGCGLGSGSSRISRVGLEVHEVTILGDLHRCVHAKNARTREVGRGGVRPLAEGKDVESVRPRDQRVILLGDPVDDRVAGAQLGTSCRPATRGPSRRARRRFPPRRARRVREDERPSGSIFSRATPTSFVPRRGRGRCGRAASGRGEGRAVRRRPSA